MTVQPMTPTGVDDKITELYALPRLDLIAEADAVEADCRQWIDDNFSFTTPQRTYFDGMDDKAFKYYGQLLSQCFRNELSVTLVYPSPPPLSIGKHVEERNTVKVVADGTGMVSVTGDLTFEMIYIF